MAPQRRSQTSEKSQIPTSKQDLKSLPDRSRIRKQSLNLPSTPAKSLNTTPNPTDAVRFLWIPYPEIPDITEDAQLSIDASNPSARFLARYPMYNEENMSLISQELGKGFANHAVSSVKPYGNIPVIHQGVATMQHLRYCFGRDVTFRSWKWLQAQLNTLERQQTPKNRRHSYAKCGTARSAIAVSTKRLPRSVQQHEIFHSSKEIPCIIFLHWTIDPGPQTSEIYNQIHTSQAQRNSLFRAFPSQSETQADLQKVGDLQALNEIAASSPPKWAYRPKTCFHHGAAHHDISTCCLAGLPQIVMKRSHSCSGKHVELLDGDRAAARHRDGKSRGWSWFGQGYERFFAEFGELGVFVVVETVSESCLGEDDDAVVRGRKGRVIHTNVTEWVDGNDAPGDMYARVASAHDWRSPYVHPRDAGDLNEFALYIYSRLRARDDWRERFESLEVGVRLDIGISSPDVGFSSTRSRENREKLRLGNGEEEKRFFVNEITRFYAADYFSQQTLGAPQQEVCFRYAEGIDGYFSKYGMD